MEMSEIANDVYNIYFNNEMMYTNENRMKIKCNKYTFNIHIYIYINTFMCVRIFV